ncbi:MAG: heme ABC exporter ATP-binding protein CcmA [Sphingomonas adhaesiva]|uniref:heme ABC exporter ATP-binding protein CcmA n=1 Tax=Sphingomonas adhaesiva TaxID=28212 RepID=UPI002FF4DD26
MSGALRVEALTLVRGGRVLFEDLSFAAQRGGAVRVSGPNGVGKSSLLRALAGLVRGTGVIERPGAVALLAEAAALDGEQRLRDALTFWTRLDAAGAPGLRVDAALAAVGLDDLGDVPVRLLSTGQRRRAALARVVASAAPLWLLDEPANGLDAPAVVRLEQLIAGHRATGGMVVAATHQPFAMPDAVEVRL